MKNLLFVSAICFALLNSCKKTDHNCQYDPELDQKKSIHIGTAIDYSALTNDVQYKKIVDETFNSITAENAFKFSEIHPENGVFLFSTSDFIADYCKTNQKRLHGHTLIWHNQLPQWVLDFQGNRADWIELMRQHIQTVVSRYKSQAVSWDVVNEAFNEDGTLRNTIWKQHIGDDYIELAFQFAREIDQNALLFYNDFNLESNQQKRNAVLSFIKQCIFKGIKIDGIGIQMHVSINQPNASEIGLTFEEFAHENLLIHLSELDISLNPNGTRTDFPAELFQEQANYLSKIFQHFNQIPKHLQYGVTFWGVTDFYSWIPNYYQREDYPLLFDKHYQIKPMYCILKSQL